MEELIGALKALVDPLNHFCRVIGEALKLIEEGNRQRLEKPVFYNKALINGLTYTLDDRERKRVFIWSPSAFTLDIVSPVSVPMTITAGTWTLLGFNTGTAYTPSGLTGETTITFKCTNDIVV